MYISVPSRNNFILILIVSIPNEPLGIIISDTRETLHTRCHICTSTGLLAQAISRDVATQCYSHKLSSNRNICWYTQPPVGRRGPAARSHNIKP
ncbi:Urease accessory UreD [Gossypium arboreum]|uniref:Urease accessory UreD n=1 Tax=Gossypium arboreum TaxID=29729 RepID=A0A0B0MEU4_GOSAR|nr:Urease accessory UreD [Gossypium arboreum]